MRVALLFSFLVFVSACQRNDGTVRAKQFVLEDDQGRVRAVLGPNAPEQPGVSLVIIGLHGERAELRVLDQGVQGLVLQDANGKVRVGLANVSGKGAGLTFTDDRGQPELFLQTRKDGFRGLNATGLNQEKFGLAVEPPGGNVGLTLTGPGGQGGAALSTLADAGSFLGLQDAAGHDVFTAPPEAKGR